MRVELTKRQLIKLSNLCVDLAKGTLLATIIGPSVTNIFDIFKLAQSTILGLIFVAISFIIDNKIEQI